MMITMKRKNTVTMIIILKQDPLIMLGIRNEVAIVRNPCRLEQALYNIALYHVVVMQSFRSGFPKVVECSAQSYETAWFFVSYF